MIGPEPGRSPGLTEAAIVAGVLTGMLIAERRRRRAELEHQALELALQVVASQAALLEAYERGIGQLVLDRAAAAKSEALRADLSASEQGPRVPGPPDG